MKTSLQPDCTIITTLEKWLEGLGSYKNVLKIPEKRGTTAPSAPLLNLPMNSSYKMTDWQGKHCSCKCDYDFGYRQLPRSVSFKTHGKLLTGQHFLKRISRPGFLSNGKTEASFQATGN